MTTEKRNFAGSGTSLPGFLWTPENGADAALLVVHGMTEHSGRYSAFAEYMTQNGLAVAAFDLRGHGEHPGDPDCAALAEGDWQKSVEDIHLVLGELRNRFDSRPLFLMGFSLGSFLVREYMEREDGKADGVILMGTGHQPRWLLKVMQAVVKTQIKKVGFTKTTPLVRTLSFGDYNQKFKPNRTDSDWLCADEGRLDAYRKDGLCRADIASGTFYELLGSMERTARIRSPRERNGFFPVLVISGADDPVGDFSAGVRRVSSLLAKAGYQVAVQIFPGARHMLLQEEAGGQAAQARAYIVQWIQAHI